MRVCAHARTHTHILFISIKAGASPLCEDRYRQTPLHYAASAGYWDITNSLMNVQDAPLNKANDVCMPM